jgi:hypothetical protein
MRRIWEQAPSQVPMPSPHGKSHPYMLPVQIWRLGLPGSVSRAIAAVACRNNIGLRVHSSRGDRNKVLRSALEIKDHTSAGLGVRGDFFRIREPHRESAIEAAALLFRESRAAQSNRFLHGYSSECGAPYHPDVGINGRACTDTVRQPQVHAWTWPASPPRSLYPRGWQSCNGNLTLRWTGIPYSK